MKASELRIDDYVLNGQHNDVCQIRSVIGGCGDTVKLYGVGSLAPVVIGARLNPIKIGMNFLMLNGFTFDAKEQCCFKDDENGNRLVIYTFLGGTKFTPDRLELQRNEGMIKATMAMQVITNKPYVHILQHFIADNDCSIKLTV